MKEGMKEDMKGHLVGRRRVSLSGNGFTRLAGAGRGLIVLVAIQLIGGCATVGHTFPSEKVQEIRLGETTKSELLGLFGLPYRRGLEDSDSTWTYLHYKYRMFGEHLRTRDLFVRFNAEGQVKSYSYSSNLSD